MDDLWRLDRYFIPSCAICLKFYVVMSYFDVSQLGPLAASPHVPSFHNFLLFNEYCFRSKISSINDKLLKLRIRWSKEKNTTLNLYNLNSECGVERLTTSNRHNKKI